MSRLKKPLFYYVYELFPEKCHNIALGDFYTYGIKVSDHEHSKVFHDVSICKKVVANMIEGFNKYQLSPIHLNEAIEDMLP